MLFVRDAFGTSTDLPKLSDAERDSTSDLLWLQRIVEDIESGALSAEDGMRIAIQTCR